MTFLLAMLLTVIDPAQYGAKADAFTATCSTVDASSDVMVDGHSFTAADVGKLALVFGAGTVTTGTNRQDLITTISAVNASTLTLSSAATITTNNIRITLGTQNQPAIQAAIDACAGTNDIIALTNGVYLAVPLTQVTGVGSGSPVFRIQRGGITFLGQGAASTTLLGCGAWRQMNGTAHRGELFLVQGAITNDYPLVFESLTLDGGVLNGNTSNHGFPANNSTGEGWDQSHCAFKESGVPQHSYRAFRNCHLTRWRGEMLIDNSTWTNSLNEVSGCLFSDGNASALNLAGAYSITSTITTNTYLAMEYYMAYANASSLMESSDFSANVVFLGAEAGHVQPQFLIRSNVFRGLIQASPAANLAIINNTFLNTAAGFVVSSAGYQGTDHNHDILISSNVFTGVYQPVALNGSGNNRTDGVRIEHNIVTGSGYWLLSGYGQNTNVTLSGNTDNHPIVNCASFTGQWAYDDGTGSIAQNDVWSEGISTISYAYGYRHGLNTYATNSWVLDDTAPTMIPAGAVMNVVLSSGAYPVIWASSVNYPNCYSARLTAAGKTFAWNGSAWQPADRIDATQVTVGILRGQ